MSQDARRDEELSVQRRSRILGIPYVDTSQLAQKNLYKELLTFPELENLRVVPLVADDHNITFGVTNMTSQTTMANLRQKFLDQRVNFVLISDTGFSDYMRLYNPPKKIEYQDIELTSAGTDQLITDVSATLEQVRADDMLAYLVQQAHKLGASDIHVENQRDHVRIRFRIDGVLHPIAKITHEKNRLLLSAIASAANISTADTEAQQGHIAQKVRMLDGADVDINLRIETAPSVNGMDVVMRLFNMEQSMYILDKLGLSEKERAAVEDIIKKPSGLVMAVGPTGSGKTTTLYSILNSLNSEERKIITIEDPVEYQFDGITQISVASKTGDETHFADKLRAVLRLDPDVVMVGEIRDNDTAKTALQASLTGHLVLTTFHAASASAALTRLLDSIGENPLFLSAIRLIMAQRLVRKLDDNTKQAYTPDEATKKRLQTVIDSLPEGVQKPDLSTAQLYKPGKSEENPYGFREQVALREQLMMSDGLRQLLQQKGMHVSSQDIETQAIQDGMVTMLQDGVLKALAGETTLEEVYRVVG